MITTILSFIKSAPSWVWIGLVAIGIVYTSYRIGRTAQYNEDVLHTKIDTIMIAYSLELPHPNKPQWIAGKVLPLPDSIKQRLAGYAQTILVKDSLLEWLSMPYQSFYEDSVQQLSILSYPFEKSIYPIMQYKPQNILVPQLLQTLSPPSVPFYRSGTAKVLYGVVSAGCLYQAFNTKGATQLYWSIGALSILTIGIAL
jgi:hypothetical protein